MLNIRGMSIAENFLMGVNRFSHGLTACVTGVWVGVDSAWEQGKPEAREMLENAVGSHMPVARFVLRFCCARFISGYKTPPNVNSHFITLSHVSVTLISCITE